MWSICGILQMSHNIYSPKHIQWWNRLRWKDQHCKGQHCKGRHCKGQHCKSQHCKGLEKDGWFFNNDLLIIDWPKTTYNGGECGVASHKWTLASFMKEMCVSTTSFAWYVLKCYIFPGAQQQAVCPQATPLHQLHVGTPLRSRATPRGQLLLQDCHDRH